jgi:hypothetical protein
VSPVSIALPCQRTRKQAHSFKDFTGTRPPALLDATPGMQATPLDDRARQKLGAICEVTVNLHAGFSIVAYHRRVVEMADFDVFPLTSRYPEAASAVTADWNSCGATARSMSHIIRSDAASEFPSKSHAAPARCSGSAETRDSCGHPAE